MSNSVSRPWETEDEKVTAQSATQGTPGKTGCSEIRALIPWMPTDSLSDSERDRVEKHARSCQACAERLAFAADFESHARELPDWHPEDESLVMFAEAPGRLGGRARRRLESHLAGCAVCSDCLEVLRTVEADDPERSSDLAISRAAASGASTRGRWGRLWEILAGGVLRPAPAAAYLAVAVLACVLLIVNDIGDRVSDPGGISATPPDGAWIGSAILLADDGGQARSGAEAAGVLFTADGQARQSILIEFTRLAGPPEAEGLYEIQISPEGGSAVWSSSVRGKTFADNYTLTLLLEPATLEPGDYRVEVLAPGGGPIFSSPLRVE